jgi:hypothetical protein
MLSRRFRWALVTCLLGSASFVFFILRSENAAIEREVIASSVREGTHVDELISQIGLPVADHPVTPGDKRDLCSEDVRNVRTVGYDFPDRGLAKTVWDWLSEVPSSSVMICLDQSNRVTNTHHLQY